LKKLYVELADTSIKREYGMKDKKSLHSDGGMLFKFPYHNRLSFWMQDTYLPLDIAFISDEGRVLQIEEMIPMNLKPITAYDNCRYALEVNKGWFKENGIRVGSYIVGYGLTEDLNRKAQSTLRPPGPIPEPGPDFYKDETVEALPEDEQMMPQQSQELQPDVVLDKTHRQILEQAALQGKKVIIQYVTKKGKSLPPKSIFPTFELLPDAEGRSQAIVRAWDEQGSPHSKTKGPGWKNFLIDNIVSITENPEGIFLTFEEGNH
jgi:uncharacterized membrane protein (UPF0127 family)